MDDFLLLAEPPCEFVMEADEVVCGIVDDCWAGIAGFHDEPFTTGYFEFLPVVKSVTKVHVEDNGESALFS